MSSSSAAGAKRPFLRRASGRGATGVQGRSHFVRSNGDLLGFLRGKSADPKGRWLNDILSWDDDRMEKVHDYIQWIFPTNEASKHNLGAPLLSPQLQRKAREDPQVREQLGRSFRRFCAFLGLEVVDAEEEGDQDKSFSRECEGGGSAAVTATSSVDAAAVDQPVGEAVTDDQVANVAQKVAQPVVLAGRMVIRKAANFESRVEVCWHTKVVGNHNWLRVSRVLHCLRLLGLDEEAAALMRCLEVLYSEGFPLEYSIKHWRKRAALAGEGRGVAYSAASDR